MPLMTRIRDSMSRIFAVFAGVFVVYIVLDWGMDITGRKHSTRTSESQDVGSVNGQSIKFKEFSDVVRQTTENQKKQTGNEPDEDQLRAIRDQVWNQMVEQELYNEEITKLGLNVTNQEIVDLVRGETPPEFLRTQFTDSTGAFNRQAYEGAIMDQRNKNIMLQVEGILRKQRLREKLQSLVMASVRVTEGDILQRFNEQNLKFDVDYLFFDPNALVKDADVKLSDDDLRRYYNEHSEEFKVDASRKFKYVMFNFSASRGDSDGVLKDMQDIVRRAEAGADFADLAKTYTETPVSNAFFKHGELSPDLESPIFATKAGEVAGPIFTSDGYHVIKVEEFRTGKDEALRASHILIRIEGTDSAAALKQAREVLAATKKGEDFAQLAQKYSKDGSASRGGDLGWFGKGRMVKPFEEAAFKAKVGQIVGPVRTPFGYHIIKVTGRDNREVRITNIHMKVNVSPATRTAIQERAQDFAFLAKEGTFAKEAEQSKYSVLETPPFQKSGIIPGIGSNPYLNKFAFGGKAGAVTEAVALQTGYGVFMISEVKEAGVRPFDEVKALIETRARRERKIASLLEQASKLRQSLSPQDSLGKLVSGQSNLTVQRLRGSTIPSILPAVGRDFGFAGALDGLNAGDCSKPFEGQRGVYLVKLLAKSGFDSTVYSASREAIRTQLLSDKRNRFMSDWFENLKKNATIVDNRDMFYR